MPAIDDDTAAAAPVRRNGAARLQLNAIRRFEQDAAIGAAHRRIGSDDAAVPDETGIDAAARVRYFAQIKRAIGRRRRMTDWIAIATSA